MHTDIVAEIGSNWEGNLVKAKKLINECKNAGANAVKFQMWRATDLYSSNHPSWKFIKKSEITFENAKKLKQICDKQKIEFYCSAFYPEAIDYLETLGVKRYKIASRTCLLKDPFSKETLVKKANTKKPIIVSMGMGGNKQQIQKIFSKNKLLFCYCISEYPLEFKKINWTNALKFDGFSDHTLGITAPIFFATLKKSKKVKNIMIEKHVKLKNSKGPDASTSIDTEQLSRMIDTIRLIETSKF
ncbi:N-acetylneuraminate synthase family protein [Candidatus Nitrosopelagicus sp.]|nr:N-acetylneuraminate synthase family protein [Candidatus Nitrosopelagicus sp.]